MTEVLNLGFELMAGYHPDYQVSGESYELPYSPGFDGPTIKYSSRTGQWYCELCR